MNIDPSMGTGNFYGIMPEETRNNSTLDGVEIDTLTARIAHYLYPRANIQNKGFERAKLEKPYDIVKAVFGSSHYNTEGQDFEEININGHYGVCLYFDLQSYIYAGVVWDSEDYILELSGDLTKKELIDLAKTAKVFKD